MTENMKRLYNDIIASLGQLPSEKKVFVFGIDENEDMDWVLAIANYIALEYIKYSYDYNDPTFSVRYLLGDADDSERMLMSRVVQYAMKYKKQELEGNPEIPPNHKFANLEMDSIEKKLKGYHFTEMNYYEHQNIHDIEIIKAIVEKRICSSKKVSNARFKEMFEQYDKMIEDLIVRSAESNHDMVFSSLALFTIEWHYSIETLYHIACFMEKEQIDEVDQKMLVLLCGNVYIESLFGESVETDSRMVKERRFVVDYLFSKRTDWCSKETMTDLIKEIIVLCVHYKEIVETEEGELYKEWFRKESTEEDWASFFRYYDLFSIWQKKEWTNKRIQNMRRLIDMTIR